MNRKKVLATNVLTVVLLLVYVLLTGSAEAHEGAPSFRPAPLTLWTRFTVPLPAAAHAPRAERRRPETFLPHAAPVSLLPSRAVLASA